MNARNKEIAAGTNGNARLRGTVLRQLAALAQMKTPELREKWRELNGAEPPAYNRQHLVRRLAYRMQEMYYGGLNECANQRLAELGQTDVLARIARKSEKKNEPARCSTTTIAPDVTREGSPRTRRCEA
jgi:hypothetical protein